MNSEYADEHAFRAWAADEITWGIFDVPETQLGVLGDVAGLDVVELGCGTAYLSAWLARRGARPTGVDLTAAQLDTARRWSREHGYPLHLGEFGAYQAADMKSREAYTRIVRDEAEKRGIGWTYWELASSFGVYSPGAGSWVEPLRHALLD